MKITASNLAKNYSPKGRTVEVLKGLNFEASNGDSIAILGPSGSGKTTFLSLMAGLDIPSQGEIRFDSTLFSAQSEEDRTRFRAENIGIIFQQFHLIPNLTALENVALPLEISGKSEAFELAKKALDRMHLSGRLDHFPSELSGGECQRVAMARALVVNPKLLLADEPSGNLDESTGNSVMDTLFEVAEELNTILLLVTHNEDLAKRCKTIMRLDNGQFR